MHSLILCSHQYSPEERSAFRQRALPLGRLPLRSMGVSAGVSLKEPAPPHTEDCGLDEAE